MPYCFVGRKCSADAMRGVQVERGSGDENVDLEAQHADGLALGDAVHR